MDNNDENIRHDSADAGTRSCCRKGCCKEEPRGKLHCFDWLHDVPGSMAESPLVEVQFKNTRKGFYRNSAGLDLNIGDMVAVEASPGHDIGQVTLVGKLVALQMRKAGVKSEADLKRVFRKAKPADIDKYNEARAKENDTMIRARRIAADMHLNMKIGDVEYQGDGNKAIFYYIADERVDFRQLIKVLAETFKVRVEMKQIGARQEAGRIGGIGPCGRPLCCASWMTGFVSVATAAARFQDISLNPQKLAGQCAKLKCCLNFEVDAYVEAIKKLPPKEVRLETADNTYYHFKFDVFEGLITYSTDKNMAANLVTIDAERAFEVMALNKAGEKPLTLMREADAKASEQKQYNDILGQDITRFDKNKKGRGKGDGRKRDDRRRRKADDSGKAEAAKAERQPKADQQAKADQPAQDNQRRRDRGQGSRRQERPEAREPKAEGREPKSEGREREQRSRGRRRGERRLRPGDTPDNAAPDAGRNAARDLPPALPPSQRMQRPESN